MKRLTLTLGFLFVLFGVQSAKAQLLKKLEKRIAKSAENAVIRKVENKTTKETNRAMDSILGNKKPKKKKGGSQNQEPQVEMETEAPDVSKETNQSINTKPNETAKTIAPWMSYDFIPGKNVIFYDTMNGEDYGDFPKRWDLLSGSAEVGRFGNNKTMLFYNPSTSIEPLFKEEDYLPKTFSIEFDIYFDELASESISKYEIYFNKDNYSPVEISSWFPFKVSYKKIVYSKKEYDLIPDFVGWHHVAMSYNDGNLKVYFDERKVLNIPRLDIVPTRINEIKINYSERKNSQRVLSIKNFKIAEGGGKPYDQMITDGKFVTHGILFDSGKAILKPQSSGVIKRVVDMLIDNPEWKFNIEGHTDSDGEEESNLILSEKRAEAVKMAIVDRGITSNRLDILGKGESEPLNGNDTSEEKANNRRVEFVLIK